MTPSKHTTTTKITCTLAENALDYLLLAGEMAGEGTPRLTKHALATLADGIELLLKARLEVENWELLFADKAKVSLKDFQSGDFKSVGYVDIMKRLDSECGINLDKAHIVVVGKLRSLRNRVRHFAITVDKVEAASLLTKTYSFAIDFITQHLEGNLADDTLSMLEELRRLLGEYQDFVDTRLKDVQPILDGQTYSTHFQCPQCLQTTLYSDGGEASCAFCRYKAAGEDAAAEYVTRFYPGSPKDYSIDPVVLTCPECGCEACLPDDDDGGGYHCVSCGEGGEYSACSSCGALTSDDNPNGDCDECWQDMLDRND
jgi:hypothetical protein